MVIVDRESSAMTPGKEAQGKTYYTPEQYTRELKSKVVE
jgi:hypothetical protein